MVTTRPPTSKSPRPLNNSLVNVPKAPITIGIIVTFMFHTFFNSQARSSTIIIIIIAVDFSVIAFISDLLQHYLVVA